MTSESIDSGREKRKTSPHRGDSVFDSDVVARARVLQQNHPSGNIAETIGDLIDELIRVSSQIDLPAAAKPDTAAEENGPKRKADAETETPV